MAFTAEEEQKITRFLELLQSNLQNSGQNQAQTAALRSLQDQAQRIKQVNTGFTAMGTVLGTLGSTAKKVTMDLAKGVGDATKELVANIMNDTMGFRTAGSFMKSMISIVTSAIHSFSDLIGSLSKTLTDTFGKGVGLVGGALHGLSKAAATAVSVLGQMAGVVIDVVVQSMEGLTKTFYDVSKSGGVFGGGMNDLASMARQAGLSIQATGKMITENSEALARSGLGIANASKTAFNVLSAGGNQLKSSLFGLGFALEDHAGIVAQAMANMSAAGDPFRANTPETVQATKDLAKNMRLMASYTGEDLKRKMEEANKYKGYLTLQRKLLELEPKQRDEFMQKFSLLTEQEKQNAMDIMEFGQIINTTGASMTASNAQYANYQQSLVENLMNTGVSLVDFERDRARVLPDLIRNLSSDRTLSTLQTANVSGTAGAMATQFGRIGVDLGTRNKEALDASLTEIEKAKEGARGLTQVSFDAAQALMKFKSDLEQTAFKLAPEFTKVFDSIGALINAITPHAVDAFRLMNKYIIDNIPNLIELGRTLTDKSVEVLDKANEVLQKVRDYINKPGAKEEMSMGGTAIGALGGALTGRSIGLFLARFIGMIPHPVAKIAGALLAYGLTAVGGAVGGIEGGSAGGGMFDMLSGLFGGGKAIGGPVNPASTYLVGERGPELFKPNSSGNIIPNDQLSTGGAPISGELVTVMREQLEQLRQLVTKSDENTAAMADIRSIQQQLLNNSY